MYIHFLMFTEDIAHEAIEGAVCSPCVLSSKAY